MTEVPVGWHIIGEFQTTIKHRPELGEQNLNRVANMRKACAKISGLVLEQGKIFSMERHVGDPSKKNGYLAGPVIVRGKLGSSTGGGLCQISTTLFNAALLSNFNILEKHNHSADIWGEKRMVELGKDAAYVYLRKDLVFKNSLKDPVMIEIDTDENMTALRCRIWSPNQSHYTIRVQHQILNESPRITIKTERFVTGERGEKTNYKRIEFYEKKY